MDEILEILSKNARLSVEDIAHMVGRTPQEVAKAVARYEKEGVIVAYKAVIDREKIEGQQPVRALIEVSVTPERDVGFDHIAERIYSFPEVISCYLISGSYDLLVIVEGPDLHSVAHFVASKLAPLSHVRSTATHFLLKRYKEDGHVLKKKKRPRRLAVSP